MKKKFTLFIVSMGIFQIIHGISHIIPFIQSIIFFSYLKIDMIHHFFNNPYMSFIWAIFGILSLYIGWKEWKYHHSEDNQ